MHNYLLEISFSCIFCELACRKKHWLSLSLISYMHVSSIMFDSALCVTPGSAVYGIFQEQYWSVMLFPTPGDLPDPEIKHVSSASPALAGRFFTTVPPEKS